MSISFRLFFALSMLAGILFLPTLAQGYSYVMMEDADLFDQSEGVVRATVAKRLPVQDGDEATRYLLTVQSTFSGPKLGSTEILSLPGTFDAPNANLIIPGVPRLSEGATILLFYSRGKDGSLRAQQLSLGLFGREQTHAGQVYVRYLEMASDLGKNGLRKEFHAPRDPVAFERWLTDRSRGIARPADYLLPEITELQSAKFNFAVFGFPGGASGSGRWFQFDSDQTLQWTSRTGGQANTASDEVAALQQALAAWHNDPNSRILLGYTGTLDNPLTCNQPADAGCFAGHVKWNDPDNEIPGSFDCNGGGTLGIGGATAFSNGQAFNGETWYPRARARVAIQDNAGCFMDGSSGADGAELLTHEVGHSLLFSHSCGDGATGSCAGRPEQDAAIMRSGVHGNGRGATLGVDDQNGIAIAYPMPPGSNVGPTVAPVSPLNNSTTSLGGGVIGANVTGNISFSVSGGMGSGTTSLVCNGTGAVSVTSGSPQNAIPMGGSVSNVVARITLTASAQQGSVQCTMTPQGGMAVNYTFNFTALAGVDVCTGDCLFRNGFE